MVRDVTPLDAQGIVTIYNHYIVHTAVTFEEAQVTVDTMCARIQRVKDASLPWLVLEEGGQLLGYAYASPWKDRSAYRFSVEISVYLAPEQIRKGNGSALYQALFQRLKDLGVHVAIGGITLPNVPSVSLHEKFAMTKVAHFEEVGRKFGQWLDVGYWQIKLSDAPPGEGV